MGKVLIPFLLLSVLLVIGCSAEAAAQDPILDTDGNPLQQGAQYHALPARRDAGGGGLRMSRVEGACPPNVVQHPSEKLRGQPLMFFPEDLTARGIIRESDRTYVLFPRPSRCSQSALWQVNDEGYVTTGGSVSDEDANRSRFAIFRSRSRQGYIIRSCPSARKACSNVAVNNENGKNLLNIISQNQAHEVVFVKVKEAESWEPTNILPATMRLEE